jgi:hypothetical protein
MKLFIFVLILCLIQFPVILAETEIEKSPHEAVELNITPDGTQIVFASTDESHSIQTDGNSDTNINLESFQTAVPVSSEVPIEEKHADIIDPSGNEVSATATSNEPSEDDKDYESLRHERNVRMESAESLETMKREIEMLKQENSALNSMIFDMKATNEALSAKLIAKDEELVNLDNQSKSYRDSWSTCHHDLLALTAELDQVKLASDSMQCQISLLQAQDELSKLNQDMNAMKVVASDAESMLAAAKDDLILCETKAKIKDNQDHLLKISLDNCELSAKAASIECRGQVRAARNCSGNVSSSASNLQSCMNYGLNFLGMSIQDVHAIRSFNYSHAMREAVKRAYNYITTVIIPAAQAIYRDRVLPLLRSIQREAEPILSKASANIYQWYEEYLSIYVEDYLAPPFVYIYEGYHRVAYYSVSFYESEDKVGKLWNNSTWAINSFSDLLHHYSQLYGLDEQIRPVLGDHTDHVVVSLAVSILMLLTWVLRRYVMGLISLMLILLISPLLLVLYVVVEIPRKMLWRGKGSGSSKKSKKRL